MKLMLIAFAVAAAGVMAGVVAESVTDEAPTTVTASAAAVFDCPAGEGIDSYGGGSRVYAVARSEDSAWVAVRDLSYPDRRVWIAATDVELDTGIDSLPVLDCGSFDSVVVLAEGSTTTTIQASTTSTLGSSTTTIAETTTTTSRGQTTTTRGQTSTSAATTTSTSQGGTTVPQDTTAPGISSATALPNKIWEEFPNLCTGFDKISQISASVTDTGSGVASVRASWTIEGQASSIALAKNGNTYTGNFGPFPYLTVPDSTDQIVSISITARDNAGNQSSTVVQVRLHSAGTCNP